MIAIVGDIHGRFGDLNQLINSHPSINLILQCGDFGFWPRVPKSVWDQPEIKNKKVIVMWAPGNHEDWEAIKLLKDNEIQPNIFYMERGSITELPDKRKVLFIGGALSIDRDNRIQRSAEFGWFEEETISQRDIEELPDENIDIVISHTGPTNFKVFDYHEEYSYPKDPSRLALDYVLEKYKPSLWYFGHMHKFQQGKDEKTGCHWTCLSAPGFGDRWWIPLPGTTFE